MQQSSRSRTAERPPSGKGKAANSIRSTKTFYDDENIAWLQRVVTSRNLDVHQRNALGNNVLMHNAIGHEGKPNEKAFYYLINQTVQPFSAEEKAEGLEILGSSHILNQEYSKGLEVWKKALSFRSIPRVRLPELDPPLVTANYLTPEWTNHDDLELIMTGYMRKNHLNILYQAMLVRLRLSKAQCSEDLHRLVTTRLSLCHSHFLEYTKIQFLIFLLEWDDTYASHSLSFVSRTDVTARKIETSIVSAWDMILQYRTFGTWYWFDQYFVIFKWLVTEISRANHENNRIIIYNVNGCFGYSLVFHLRAIVEASLDENQSAKLKNVLQGLIRLRDEVGRNLLLMTCAELTYKFVTNRHPTYYSVDRANHVLHFKNVMRLLIEAGADVYSVDDYGNTCLHLLINDNEKDLNQCRIAEQSVFDFLLNHGARWDLRNNQNRTAEDKLQRVRMICATNNERIVSASASYFTLQWLCARVLRREKIELSRTSVPRVLIDYIKHC